MTELVGQQLGHYYLRQLQGRGGFADVYQGEHIHLKSLAAIKILHSRISSDLQDSFIHEARILARLTHPHIIRILDFGIENSVPFLVMEFAPNGTIRQRYPQGSRLPLATIVSFVRQITDGLQYAHDQKLIHRDLKPENLLFSQRDELLLSDFGIALIAQTSLSTPGDQQNRFAGTASYMAPEQFQGHPTYASDQYSLAIMVYEWLSGKRPFSGTFIEIYSQHHSTPPQPLRDQVPGLPEDVERVIMTALAKEPERRFASVKAFAHALEQASGLASSLSQQYTQLPAPISSIHTPSQSPSPFSTYPLLSSPSSNPPPAEQSALSSSPPVNSQISPAMRSLPTQEMLRSLPPQEIQPKLLPATSTADAAVTSSQSSSTTGGTQPPQAKPRWFLQRKFLAIVLLIVVLLAGSNIAAAFILRANPSAPTLHLTPTTASSAPTQTPGTKLTPTPPPSSSAVSYASSLSAQDNANWDTYGNSKGGCAFKDGAYHATISQGGTFTICNAENTNVTDFSCQVQMTILGGDGGGLVFRNDAKSGSGYRLRIGPDGAYDLASQHSTIVSSNSTAIKQGVNQVNTIKVVAIGSHISLYANGKLITTIQDTSATSGRIGLLAVDFNNNADVAFSNIQVTAL